MRVSYPTLGNSGRLGNQLWEIAATLGIARSQGTEPLFPSNWSYRPFFNVPEGMFGDTAESLPADQLATHLDVRVRAYLQDYQLFYGQDETIREWFTPTDLAKRSLNPEMRFPLEETVAVHVRRGDNVWQQDYFWLPTVEYYQQALELAPIGPVSIFSDDIPWCRETLAPALDREVQFYEGVARAKEHEPTYNTVPVLDWIDLLLMTRCMSHVTSNSTYAWWGAWLSDDPSPIYPSKWTSHLLAFVNTSLMFPPNWRMIQL